MVSRIVIDFSKIRKSVLSLTIFTGSILVSIVGSAVYPLKMVDPSERPYSEKFPSGTDSWGRDLLVLLLHGIKNSYASMHTQCLVIRYK